MKKVVIDFREVQDVQIEFVKFLESRPEMINIKNKFAVTKQQSLCMLSELYEVENETKCHKWWDKQPVKQCKVLEELTDLLSHICNTANQLEIQLVLEEVPVTNKDLESQILSLTRHIYELPYLNKLFFTKQKIVTIFKEYIQLVNTLGFTIEQLENEYYNKLESNYKRFK